MTKYRIRLKNGRVIGPFDINQIHDLKAKGHIAGNEDAQVFPLGDWKPMTAFDFYADLMDENKTVIQPRNEDSTFVIDLSQIRQKRNEKEIDKILVEPQTPAEQLTETMRLTPTKVSSEIEKLKNNPPPSRGNTAITISQEIELPPEVNEREDKKIINPVAKEEIQKMRRQQEEAEQF